MWSVGHTGFYSCFSWKLQLFVPQADTEPELSLATVKPAGPMRFCTGVGEICSAFC